MREVLVLLSPALFEVNAQLIQGLRRNGLEVCRFNCAKDKYSDVLRRHSMRLHAEPRRFLCLAWEDSTAGVRAARQAGVCVIGIASNRIELDHMRSTEGAHAVALSVADLLEDFGVRDYYQVQYLPFAIYLRNRATRKAGYPTSLLDTLSGRFLLPSVTGNTESTSSSSACLVDTFELDSHANRIIPREILGVVPGSLADVYINDIGWTDDDESSNFRLNAKEIERDVVRILARFYGYPDDFVRGFITSGGTEGNFTGLWWNRDYLMVESGGQPPIFLTSSEAHYSISKAVQQLAMEGRLIASTITGEIDCQDLGRVLDEIATEEPNRPILMNCTVGTTQTGALDDIPQVHKLLVEKVRNRGGKFSIHVDAALMGAVLPIIKPFGKVDYFRNLDVTTIAISGHKFFGSICICGVCLTTAPFLAACFARRDVGVNYLTGLHDFTPSGSRSGFSALSFHNTLCGLYMHTDSSRLKSIVAQCYHNVDYFVSRISALVGPDEVIHAKHSLTVCFPRPSKKLMQRYILMPVDRPKLRTEMEAASICSGNIGSTGSTVDESGQYAGVCILVNVDKKMIDRFLIEYEEDRNEVNRSYHALSCRGRKQQLSFCQSKRLPGKLASMYL